MKNIKNNKNVNKNLFNVLYKTPKKILKESKNRKFSLPGIYYKNFNNNNNDDNNNKFKIAIYKKIPEIEKYFNISDKIINNLQSKESMGLFEENFSSFSKDYNHRKNCLSLSINKNKKIKGILNLKNVKQHKKHIQFIDRKNFRLKSSPIRKSISNIFSDDNNSNLNKSIESSLSSKKKRIKKSSTLSANFKYKKDYLKIKSIKSISSLSSYVNNNNNNNNDNNDQNNNTKPFQLYRTSILDKMILKITNPEEIFEDYLLDNRPSDNYIRFRINLKKQKIKIEKLLIELRASQKKSDYEIKKYNPKLKKKNINFFNSKY